MGRSDQRWDGEPDKRRRSERVSSFEILELIDPEAAEAYEVDYGTVGEETSDSSVFDPHKELGFWCARCPVGICVWCRCCARATCNLIDAGICVR